MAGIHRDHQIVGELTASLQGVTSCEERRALLADAVQSGRIEKLNPILYRCGDYLIHDILLFAAKKWVPILEMLNKKNFRIFPELAAAVAFSDYCTVFVRIEGMGGEDLCPFEETGSRVPREVKQSAYRELERLCEGNLYVPWPPRGSWGWQTTADHQRIIAPVRGNVVSIVEDPVKKAEILEAYRKYLFSGEY